MNEKPNSTQKTEQEEKIKTKDKKKMKEKLKPQPPGPPGFFSELFFFQFNFLFRLREDQEVTEDIMLPLPNGINTKTLLPKALKIKEEISSKNKKKEKNQEQSLIDNTLKGIRKRIDFLDVTDEKKIQTVIYRLIKPKIANAVLLRILEKVIITALSIIPVYFIPELKKSFEERDVATIVVCPILAFLLTFLRGMIKEHCGKFLNQCGSTTGQTLRAMFYDKIEKSNISFLANADTTVISKITMFEITKISSFVGKVPDVVGFPVTVALSCAVLVYRVSWRTLVMILIFLVTWLFLLLLAKLGSIQNLKREYYSSRRGQKIDEILKDIETMKFSNYENNLRLSINNLRQREVMCLMSSNYYKMISTFLMSMSVVATILVIIYIESEVEGGNLQDQDEDSIVTLTFAIVAIVSNMSKPMKAFVTILEQYFYYLNAAKALNKILFILSYKPEDCQKEKKLKKGEIAIKDCSIEVEDNGEVLKLVEGIFGEDLNLEREKRQSERSLSRMASQVGKKKKTVGMSGQIVKGFKVGFNSVKESVGVAGSKVRNFSEIFQRKKEKQIMDIKREVVHHDLNLHIRPKEKVCFVGDDNQGLPELIGAILGESFITEGFIKYNGTTSYIDGKFPGFLKGKSVKENIVFGSKYSQDVYVRALETVELDTKSFIDGDESIILSNAVNFSLTERTKILLARILYQDHSDIYIFDNVFDEINPKLISKLYDRVVKDYLKDKTVLIRSSNKVIMKKIDRIVAFKDRVICYDGNPGDFILMISDLDDDQIRGTGKKNLKDGIKNVMDINKVKRLISDVKMKKNKVKLRSESKLEFKGKQKNKEGFKAFEVRDKQNMYLKYMQDASKNTLGKSKLLKVGHFNILDESKIFNNMSTLLKNYLLYRGIGPFVLILILYGISISVFVGIDFWAGVWSRDLLSWTTDKYIWVWIALIFTGGFLVMLRDYIYYKIMTGHSNLAHDKLKEKLLRVDLKWFNTTERKRIIFKFTYDVKVLDTVLSTKVQGLLESFTFLVAGFLILNGVYLGVMVIVSFIIILYANSISSRFLRTIKGLVKIRSEKAARLNQVFGFVNYQMLNFRMADKEYILRDMFNTSSNEFQRAATHIAFYGGRWLGIRMVIINTSLITVSYLLPLFFNYVLDYGLFNKDVFELAFATSWSLKMTDFLTRFLRSYISVYSDMDSFGRLENLIEQLKEEDGKRYPIIPNYRINFKEKNGNENLVEMKNVSVSMSGRRLMHISDLKIKKGEKIALVGAGGSGRRLFFNAVLQLFKRDRSIPGKAVSSYQFLGNNIDEYSKRSLRSRIGYVDLDAFIYSGTIRQNLDPDFVYTEDELIRALFLFSAQNFLYLEKNDEDGGNWVLRYKDDDDLRTDRLDPNQVNLTELSQLVGDSKILLSEEAVKVEAREQEALNSEKIKLKKRQTKTIIPEIEVKHRKILKAFLDNFVSSKTVGIPLDLLNLIATMRAFLKNPKILLAYQKSIGFGLQGFDHILELFKTLHGGNISFVIIVKDLSDLKYFDRAILLRKGQIVEDGNLNELIENPNSKLSAFVDKNDPGTYNYLRMEIENAKVVDYEDHQSEFFDEQMDDGVMFDNRFG